MVGITLRQELLNFIQYMHDQGILDIHFDNIMDLQSPGFPRFVSEIISVYIYGANINMATITNILSDEVVNFDQLLADVLQLEASTRSIGGCRMAGVCYDLHQACHDEDQERCIEIFETVKLEFQTLCDTLKDIGEKAQSVLSYESRRRRQ